jgi:hypothetical protein
LVPKTIQERYCYWKDNGFSATQNNDKIDWFYFQTKSNYTFRPKTVARIVNYSRIDRISASKLKTDITGIEVLSSTKKNRIYDFWFHVWRLWANSENSSKNMTYRIWAWYTRKRCLILVWFRCLMLKRRNAVDWYQFKKVRLNYEKYYKGKWII